ncbi:MAG: hypothetical protein M1158_00045 [Candidatus Marsarchaeota archaeon]|jgi:tRNA (cytidine56-2'-O)-methyltransferase|nr:hypothetical protein [Candidatus Marsarchaeota archaeon]
MIAILAIGRPTCEYCMDLGLAARAFGASSIIFTTPKNQRVVRYFNNISSKWGGNFSVEFTNDWKRVIESKKNYKSVYLTRFGVPIKGVESMLRTYKNLIVVISTTDNRGVLKRADFNVSISTQPHTSISALSVFLHEFYSGRELAIHFENAKYKVVPAARGMRIAKS